MRLRLASKAASGCLAVLAVACSGGSSSTSGAAPQAPIPFLLQYAGEYDGTGQVTQLALHVDGTFDATIDGQATHGTYEGPPFPGDASITLQAPEGRTFTASFRVTTPSSAVPPQVMIDVKREDGTTETLASPWVAGNEGMCWATYGTWHDDDPDPATGLLCICDRGNVFLPSRGGCVAPRRAGDPPRLPVSNEAQRRAGMFDGSKRISSITLATDGRYQAVVDGQLEQGTWWDATYSPSRDEDSGTDIGCTSALHAFGATLEEDGSLAVRWGTNDSETLYRH